MTLIVFEPNEKSNVVDHRSIKTFPLTIFSAIDGPASSPLFTI